jgi:hypothetical protein
VSTKFASAALSSSNLQQSSAAWQAELTAQPPLASTKILSAFGARAAFFSANGGFSPRRSKPRPNRAGCDTHAPTDFANVIVGDAGVLFRFLDQAFASASAFAFDQLCSIFARRSDFLAGWFVVAFRSSSASPTKVLKSLTSLSLVVSPSMVTSFSLANALNHDNQPSGGISRTAVDFRNIFS